MQIYASDFWHMSENEGLCLGCGAAFAWATMNLAYSRLTGGSMSKADQQFVAMCRDILDHGTTTEGQKVRPVWEDGTPAYTLSLIHI